MLLGDPLYQQDSGRYAGQRAKSAIVNEANESVQTWLNQFGTARIQLNVNDDFHLDNSALDFLIPLYDGESSMLFTQLGARNKNSRNTINIGTGVRTYTGNWMYGINTFFDNDVTGHNKRIGVGTEVWTDYLKLSANGYLGTTDWHPSRDIEYYNERPADGYDIRAEAYLPSYAQLGGKLMYEKYKGDEVALFGTNNRQKDPYAVTAGLNYTPIPLVTLGVDHRVGKGSNNDTSFNLQLNYRLGESWQKHISPSAVAASRTLAGSRYDLVERNNNIVLDYQKHELIRLTLPSQLVGVTGDTALLTAQVVTKHAIDRIDWEASSLIAAGGSINPLSSHVIQVTYPPYQSTNNTYTLHAVAHDIRGNSSNRATTLIKVNSQELSTTHSTLEAAPLTIEANGSDTSVVTLTLRDGSNNPVTGQTVTFNTSLGSVGTPTESGNGVYTAALTAGTLAGSATITANVGGSPFNVPPATVILNGDSGDLSTTHSTLLAAPLAIEANGSDTSVVTLTLRDGSNNPVTGQTVTFDTSLGSVGTATESSNGVYTTSLTAATVAGTATITANVGGSPFNITPATVILNGDSGDLSTTYSTLLAAPLAIEANGSDTSVVTLTLRDGSNNPVTGQSVTFNASLGSVGTATESSNGVYTASLTAGTVAGTATITANVGGSPFNITPATVILNGDSGDLSTAHSTLEAAPLAIEANGSDTSVVTLTLRDGSNNPVTGQTVTFDTSLGSVGTPTESGNGVYTAALTAGTLAGSATITANVGGSPFNVTPVTVILSLDLSHTNSFIMANPPVIEANGSDTSQIMLYLRDSNNNPVTGQNVTFDSTLGTVGAEGDNGNIYFATLTAGTVAGTATITANVDGSPFNITPATVILNGDSGDLSTAHSTLLAAPLNIEANGSDTSELTLTLRDGNNNPVTGQTVTFDTSLGSVGTPTESGNGVYTASLTAGTVSGAATITVNVGRSPFNIPPVTVTLSPGVIDIMNSVLTVSTDSINADDRTGALITFLARDAHNNSIPALGITFTTDLVDSQITNMSHSDAGYTANIDGTKVGVANISVQSSGTEIAGLTETVTITPGAWNQAQEPPVVAITQPIGECFQIPSGIFQRKIVLLDSTIIYDNYGNETTGNITMTMFAGNALTTNSSTITFSALPNHIMNTGITNRIVLHNDNFSTEALCNANGVTQTNVTLNIVNLRDSFGTYPIGLTLMLGTGS
ncbi:invasin domain 3-containing protein [Yersinia pekkanenii]|nr:invasin domain 3-containing protein [Yersinia pekkanenii]